MKRGMLLFGSILIVLSAAKQLDPYKILGVDKSASPKEIQKAFHKLSLKYHPDKNKNKGAQQKFEEINNAYDILSDEQKRKNYDLYGSESGRPGFDSDNSGNHGGRTYFTSGGPGGSGFSFRPGGWENMGGDGSSSFSFSFGDSGSGKQNSFDFGLNDIFSNMFGGGKGGGNQFGGFRSPSDSQYRSRGSSKSIPSVNSKVYNKEIKDRGMTWLLLFYSPNVQRTEIYESILEEVSVPLQGVLKVGSINCQSEPNLCKDLGVHLHKVPKVFVHSYSNSESGALVEYSGDLDVKSLKKFCQDMLPRFSKGVDLGRFKVTTNDTALPKVILLSTKKHTPMIWRALSGLYRKRIAFYNAEVQGAYEPSVSVLGVDSVPAIIGWLSNGEKHVLKSGISVKSVKHSIQELSDLLEGFEKRNKKLASDRDHTESGDGNIPLLVGSNFDDICGDKVPVCIIGAFRSSKTKNKLQSVLRSVSQKSFSRRQNIVSGSRDLVSYALLDATKHQSFLNAFDKLGFKTSDKLLMAYKPKRGSYATYEGEITEEATESFVSSILNGDVRFAKTKQKPTMS